MHKDQDRVWKAMGRERADVPDFAARLGGAGRSGRHGGAAGTSITQAPELILPESEDEVFCGHGSRVADAVILIGRHVDA